MACDVLPVAMFIMYFTCSQHPETENTKFFELILERRTFVYFYTFLYWYLRSLRLGKIGQHKPITQLTNPSKKVGCDQMKIGLRKQILRQKFNMFSCDSSRRENAQFGGNLNQLSPVWKNLHLAERFSLAKLYSHTHTLYWVGKEMTHNFMKIPDNWH